MAILRTRSIWNNMKARCYNPKHHGYDRYGGRGISVCDEWRFSFTAFNTWALSNGYTDDLKLDRRDGNDNYTPDNCRWVTQDRQSQNMKKWRSPTLSRFKGVTLERRTGKWRAHICCNKQQLYLGCFTREEGAARAYDKAAVENFGEFAMVNFPMHGGVSCLS